MARKADRKDAKGRHEGRHDLWRERTVPVLEEIRRLLDQAGLSQRALERRVGFSKGYISQLLARNLDLKLWHVLAMLDGLGESPGKFFGRIFPCDGALDRFQASSMPLSENMEQLLARLYAHGVEPLGDLRERLVRCERAIEQLVAQGYLRSGQTGGK